MYDHNGISMYDCATVPIFIFHLGRRAWRRRMRRGERWRQQPACVVAVVGLMERGVGVDVMMS